MVNYPRLNIDLKKIKENTEKIIEICSKKNIAVMGVTKGFCCDEKVVKAMKEGGVKMFADSRLVNIEKVQNLKEIKVMIRLPMKSHINELVKFSDMSLNSEIETIREINRVSYLQNKIHDIILMVELGDLREGIEPVDLFNIVKEVLILKNVKLKGIGTNLTCYGGVIPDSKNLGLLCKLAEEIEEEFGIKLDIISGGNSSSLHLIEKNEIPNRINNLRIGEGILLGKETAYGEYIKDLHMDIFSIEAEIVEIKNKNSIPIGNIGMDAFGNKPKFKGSKRRDRAILAIGRQDIDPDGLFPIDEEIVILGASSDHLIIDITDSEKKYNIGSIVRFNLNYSALLRSATSPYVYKNYFDM